MDERVESLVGTRRTAQRRSLLEFLLNARRCLSAQEIHAELARRGSPVSLATVYRTVARLVRAGALDVVLRADGEATYVAGSAQHHHFLVCRVCGRADEIADPVVERWACEEAADRGFTEVSHALTVFGVCPECRGADE